MMALVRAMCVTDAVPAVLYVEELPKEWDNSNPHLTAHKWFKAHAKHSCR